MITHFRGETQRNAVTSPPCVQILLSSWSPLSLRYARDSGFHAQPPERVSSFGYRASGTRTVNGIRSLRALRPSRLATCGLSTAATLFGSRGAHHNRYKIINGQQHPTNSMNRGECWRRGPRERPTHAPRGGLPVRTLSMDKVRKRTIIGRPQQTLPLLWMKIAAWQAARLARCDARAVASLRRSRTHEDLSLIHI